MAKREKLVWTSFSLKDTPANKAANIAMAEAVKAQTIANEKMAVAKEATLPILVAAKRVTVDANNVGVLNYRFGKWSYATAPKGSAAASSDEI